MTKKLLTLLLLVGLTCQAANAERVTRVIDGDTVILSETGRARLSGIDAPELKQLGGNESKMFLQILTADRDVVCVKAITADRYNRSLCELYAGSINLNQMMVLHGWAWDYREYSHGMYEDDMLEAQVRHWGLWHPSLINTPPWIWRKQQRQKRGK